MHIHAYIHTCTYLGVEHIGVYWLVVVVLVAILVEAVQRILQYLVYCSLAPSSGPHTHEAMTHQLGLIELDHLVCLRRRRRRRRWRRRGRREGGRAHV